MQVTLDGARFVVAAAPTLALFAVAAIIWNLPLAREKKGTYRRELDRREAAESGLTELE